MSMFENFAKDVSENLFNSIYGEMFEVAVSEQKSIYKSRKKNGYYVGEAQEKLNEFSHNKLSIGEALEFLKIRKVYAVS